MPFVVLGDPNFETSIEIIKNLIDNGAGALELGFAFSDPIADGPVIQRANLRALKNGITIEKGFGIIEHIRKYSQIPISLMLSFNLVFNYGVENFYSKVAQLKVNAILCPDVPIEESDELVFMSEKYGISQVFIVSPISNDERIERIAKICKGYVYLVSLLGTTGSREEVNSGIAKLIERTRKFVNIPIYVGFGISKPKHVREIFIANGDGAISGSAICALIEENLGDNIKIINEVGHFCREMSSEVL
jgi:tryptophan synthase alpha chain